MDPGLQRAALVALHPGNVGAAKTKTAAGITADGRLNGIFNRDVTSDI
jgi:hypothetical protein